VAAKDPTQANPHAAVDLFLVEAGTPGFEKGKRIIDKNFLFVGRSILSRLLYVKKILTTKYGILHR